MFDLGWSELLVIGVVALIVVGPKDLPVLFRRVGQFVGKARGMAREFSRAMEQAADEAGVKETAKSLKSIADPKKMGLDAVKDATRDVTDSFKGWNPDSETGKLAAERAEAAKKIQEATAKKATERKAAEEAAKAAEAAAPAPETKPAPKPAAKKPAAKSAAKPAAKPAAKKPATKPAAKPATKKPAAKTPTTKSESKA